MKLVSDLRTVRPFAAAMGRKFPQFEKILSPFHNSLIRPSCNNFLVFLSDVPSVSLPVCGYSVSLPY
jgi:hypothetical protein